MNLSTLARLEQAVDRTTRWLDDLWRGLHRGKHEERAWQALNGREVTMREFGRRVQIDGSFKSGRASIRRWSAGQRVPGAEENRGASADAGNEPARDVAFGRIGCPPEGVELTEVKSTVPRGSRERYRKRGE